MNYSKQAIQSSVQNWISDVEWQIFGTLNFATRSHLRNVNVEDVCGKMWRSYFGTVDRAIFGTQRKNQHRFARAVFVQYGSNGDNPHVHFLATLPIAPEEGCVLLNAIWSSQFAEAAAPASNEFTPVISKHKAAEYGLHEFQSAGSITHDLSLSHMEQPENIGTPRNDALEALRAKATDRHLLSARLNFPVHLQAAQARFERRKGERAAALLRS